MGPPVHNEADEIEYELGDIVLPEGASAKTTAPADPTAFLGAAGSSLWGVLPELEDPALLFLGIGTKEVPNGVFDWLTVTLKGIKGAGECLWAAGRPFNTRRHQWRGLNGPDGQQPPTRKLDV